MRLGQFIYQRKRVFRVNLHLAYRKLGASHKPLLWLVRSPQLLSTNRLFLCTCQIFRQLLCVKQINKFVVNIALAKQEILEL